MRESESTIFPATLAAIRDEDLLAELKEYEGRSVYVNMLKELGRRQAKRDREAKAKEVTDAAAAQLTPIQRRRARKPLKEQFGERTARDRRFREQITEDLAAIKEVFPKLKIELTSQGMEMEPVDPWILALQKR